MSDVFKTLLSLGITAGLSDRESFVKEVSGFIEEYQHDPQNAKKWAAGIASYLENVKGNLNTEKAFRDAMSDVSLPDRKQIEKLTSAIERLTRELENQREK